MKVDEIAASLSDGMVVGIGGWGGRRKPMAAIRAILRSPVKDLTIVSYGGADVGMLCAAGKIKKLIFGFVSHDAIPLDGHFRAARQGGAIECVDFDEGMLQWGLRAAAMRLPFLPTRTGLASDVVAQNTNLKTVKSPYTDGEELLAMPAINLDVAILHANVSDKRGNSQIHSPDPFFDELMARAATKTYLTVERLVETEALGGREGAHTNYIERNLITGVAEVPHGAHPTSCDPQYGIDVGHLKTYMAAKGEDEWAAYCDQFVNLPDQASYVNAVGGEDHIKFLRLPGF